MHFTVAVATGAPHVAATSLSDRCAGDCEEVAVCVPRSRPVVVGFTGLTPLVPVAGDEDVVSR